VATSFFCSGFGYDCYDQSLQLVFFWFFIISYFVPMAYLWWSFSVL